jgi:hypothetical protein
VKDKASNEKHPGPFLEIHDGPVKVFPRLWTAFAVAAVDDTGPDRYLVVGLAPHGCQVATRDEE